MVWSCFIIQRSVLWLSYWGLPQLHLTLFSNTDTFSTLVNTDSFNTMGSVKLYGLDSRVGFLAPTCAEPFPAFVSLDICARACVLCIQNLERPIRCCGSFLVVEGARYNNCPLLRVRCLDMPLTTLKFYWFSVPLNLCIVYTSLLSYVMYDGSVRCSTECPNGTDYIIIEVGEFTRSWSKTINVYHCQFYVTELSGPLF